VVHVNGHSDTLGNIVVNVVAKLGRTKMAVADILKLGTASIVNLDRLASGPVDLLLNNRLWARGEIVVVDDKFGVRITEIIERV
jgi:flagellar motor switch protein FliN/FliY